MLRFLVLGMMGLLLAGFGTIAYIALRPPAEAPAAAHRRVAVLVATGPLRAGSLLQPADLSARDVEASEQPPGTHPDNAEERRSLTGGMVRRTLVEAEPILNDDVLRPGDRGFLAAVLAPGSRAVSVAVDAVSGAAGLIWPGDRVDVILTQTLDQPEQGLGHRVSGETVLADARVIAVDQQLVQGGQASGLLDPRATPASRTITLEVEPRDAARIAVATRLGKLQVVLRAAQPEPGSPPAPGRPPLMALEAPAPLLPRLIDSASAATPPPGPVAPAPPRGTAESVAPPIWGADVSRALGDGGQPRDAEVRLFDGGRRVEAYHF